MSATKVCTIPSILMSSLITFSKRTAQTVPKAPKRAKLCICHRFQRRDEEKQEDKRKDKARFSRENLKARKEHIVEGIQKISEISPAEFLRMAKEWAEVIPQSEIHADLHGLAALIERVSIDEDGCVKDPDAVMPMESISSALLTPEVMAEIEARLAKK
ncbi:hypothetical protein FRC11_009597 [Ceratobasidium sp. 423]|nr:hypothetical protein FRC11_009597 [Ceratobasidium sp. 423]